MARTDITPLPTATTAIRDIPLAITKAVITVPAMAALDLADTVHVDTAIVAKVDTVGTVTVAMDTVTDQVGTPMGVADMAGPVTVGRGMPESGWYNRAASGHANYRVGKIDSAALSRGVNCL